MKKCEISRQDRFRFCPPRGGVGGAAGLVLSVWGCKSSGSVSGCSPQCGGVTARAGESRAAVFPGLGRCACPAPACRSLRQPESPTALPLTVLPYSQSPLPPCLSLCYLTPRVPYSPASHCTTLQPESPTALPLTVLPYSQSPLPPCLSLCYLTARVPYRPASHCATLQPESPTALPLTLLPYSQTTALPLTPYSQRPLPPCLSLCYHTARVPYHPASHCATLQPESPTALPLTVLPYSQSPLPPFLSFFHPITPATL
ncbi:hypothetical protein JZ751_008564 [Albula glossodonta]|uniref:Uncharacterized protein n=1 Tax=Albula glossodonta TaxID=121402 RepID=A0A8T2MN60_9TELE|nr:hypothetical protein JZ751_008564 [Albula glossodonta]